MWNGAWESMSDNDRDPRSGVHDSGRDCRRPALDTPGGYFQGIPAKLLLDRLPVPILAVHQDGTVVHANVAFEHMLGYPRSELIEHPAERIFADTDTGNPTAGAVRLHERAGDVVDLLHTDGSTVKALVSKSALVREEDPVALVAFCDVTEQLWTQGSLAEHQNWRGPVDGQPW